MILKAFAATMIACLGPSAASSSDAPASFTPRMTSPTHDDLSAYRQYVKEQADLLVGMTKVLVTEVKDGNVDAAQSAYAPAHRYLARIAPAARLLRDLDDRIDAQADGFAAAAADPPFSGFHRIEHALFAARSTSGLAGVADRLDLDVRALRAELAQLDMTPAALVEGSAHLVRDLADRSLDGSEERYSRTDLWDIEAGVDGVDAALASLAPQTRARSEAYFADIRAALETHKAGCGFKGTNELSRNDKIELKRRLSALTEAIATPHGLSSID